VPNGLYYAALFGLTDIAQQLINEGEERWQFGGRWGYPLISAASSGHLDFVQMIIDSDDSHMKEHASIFEWAPLYAAKNAENEDICQRLLTSKALSDAKGRFKTIFGIQTATERGDKTKNFDYYDKTQFQIDAQNQFGYT